jgi:hypothetical protein
MCVYVCVCARACVCACVCDLGISTAGFSHDEIRGATCGGWGDENEIRISRLEIAATCIKQRRGLRSITSITEGRAHSIASATLLFIVRHPKGVSDLVRRGTRN